MANTSSKVAVIKEHEDRASFIECDADCRARAMWRASFLNGPLYFCGHHFARYSKGNALQNGALEIVHL